MKQVRGNSSLPCTGPMRWLLPFVVTALVVVSAWGRVFYRLGWASDEPYAATRLGWDLAHRAEMTVNGMPGVVKVMRSNRDVRASLERIRAAYAAAGGRTVFRVNEDVGWGLARVNGRTVRMLAFSLNGQPEALVVSHESSPSRDARMPRSASDLPVFPGSVPSFSASSMDTRTAVVVSRAHAVPEDLRAYFDEALQSNGWTPAPPTVSGASIYLKDQEICCVSASSTGHSKESVVILLRKRLGGGIGS